MAAELKSAAKPFIILIDHKNLNYFATKRLLNKRQARYNDTLQQYNFIIQWRAGAAGQRPDALSKRYQDKPTDIDDERNAGRVIQLLPSISLNPVTTVRDKSNLNQAKDPAAQIVLFDNNGLQTLWMKGVETDKDWKRARNAVWDSKRSFPPDIALKFRANIAECTVAADRVLRGR